MIFLFSILALAIIITIIAIKFDFRLKKQKALSAKTESELAAIAFDNFGHSFEIESVVNEELRKINKPLGTIFSWETKEVEGIIGPVIQIILKNYKEDSAKVNISLVTYRAYGGYGREQWKEYYAGEQRPIRYEYNIYVDPQKYYELEIKESAEKLVKQFKIDFPEEYSGEKKMGVV